MSPVGWRRIGCAFALGALGLWSVVWVAGATERGLAGGDRASYLGMAADIRGGLIPTTPFLEHWDRYVPEQFYANSGHQAATHFPFGYPAALSAVSLFTGNVGSAGRLLGGILLPINLVLVALLTARMIGSKSWVVPLLPPLLLILLPDSAPAIPNSIGWLPAHATIGSEALFAALFMVTLLALAKLVSSERGSRGLPIVIVLGAACFAIRYVGGAAVLTILFALIFLDRDRPVLRRIARAFVVAVACVAPVALYLGWGSMVGGSGALGPYSPSGWSISPFTRSFSVYLVGAVSTPSTRYAISGLLVLLIVGLVALSLVRRAESWREDREGGALVILTAFAIFAFCATVMFSRVFLAPATFIDIRMLMPIRGLLYALIVALIYLAISNLDRPRAAVVGVVLLAAAGFAAGWNTQRLFLDRWYAYEARPTAVERTVTNLPPGSVVGTNLAAQAYVETGLPVVVMPNSLDYSKLVVHSQSPSEVNRFGNSEYRAEVSRFVKLLNKRGGYILWYPHSGFVYTAGVLTPEKLGRLVPLKLVQRVGGQSLYRVLPAARRAGRSSTG